MRLSSNTSNVVFVRLTTSIYFSGLQRYCGHLIHQLLGHDVWQVGDAACKVRAQVSVLRSRDQLFGVYSDRERAGHRVCRMENLTASMFANSSCHMNGAETSSFLGFVVVLADRWKHAISDGDM